MELDAFRARLGRGQGRLRPQRAAAASGDYVFVLGQDEAGWFHDLAPGDRCEVGQDVDLTGVDLVRADLRLRMPASVPPGLAWEASITVDGAKHARSTCEPGRTRAITDLAANVSKLSGVRRVSVQLELVAT